MWHDGTVGIERQAPDVPMVPMVPMAPMVPMPAKFLFWDENSENDTKRIKNH